MLFLITLCQFIFDLTDILFTNLFHICENSLFHSFRCDECNHIVPEIFRCIHMFILMFLFTALFHDLVNELDDLFVNLMCLKDSFHHGIFRNLIGACLDHDHLFRCGCHSKIKIRYLLLLRCRIHDKLAIYQTDDGGSDRSVKGDIRDGCRDGRTKHGCHFRRTLRIHRHYQVVQCNIVAVIFGE